MRRGQMVQLSRPPRAIWSCPIFQMLNRKCSRFRATTSSTARFAVTEYSIDCRKCHGPGFTGSGTSALGICRFGMNGISIGVGFPTVSVSSPIMLWKYAVVRSPPFHQVEYPVVVRITTPPLSSATKRLCIALPTTSSCVRIMGWRL